MGHVPVTIYEAKELSVCFWRKTTLAFLWYSVQNDERSRYVHFACDRALGALKLKP